MVSNIFSMHAAKQETPALISIFNGIVLRRYGLVKFPSGPNYDTKHPFTVTFVEQDVDNPGFAKYGTYIRRRTP